MQICYLMFLRGVFNRALSIYEWPWHFTFSAFTIDAQKLSRGGYSSSGLIPFPRTGRSVENSDPEATAEFVRNYYAQKQNGNAPIFEQLFVH